MPNDKRSGMRFKFSWGHALLSCVFSFHFFYCSFFFGDNRGIKGLMNLLMYRFFYWHYLRGEEVNYSSRSRSRSRNIVCQTFWICESSIVWRFGHVKNKRNSPRIHCTIFLQISKTFLRHAIKICLIKSIVLRRGQTVKPIRLTSWFQMFDKECLIVCPGPKFSIPLPFLLQFQNWFYGSRHRLSRVCFQGSLLYTLVQQNPKW